MTKLDKAAAKYREALAMEADLAGQIERHEQHGRVLAGRHVDAVRARKQADYELSEAAKETP